MEDAARAIRGFAIVGEDGSRIIGTPFPPGEEVKKEERSMFAKVKSSEGEVLLYKDLIVIYKLLEDVCLILYAPVSENEVILHSALEAFYSAALRTLKGPLTRRSLLKHYDQIFLLLDCFIYKTVILTDSPEELYQRMTRRTFEGLDAIPIPSKFGSVFKKAQKSFKSSWFG